MARHELRSPLGPGDNDAEGFDVGDRAHGGNEVGQDHQ
jgi:hypothetical protein